MNRTEHGSKYFYGHRISDYGLERGYLDYRTLSQAFDAVLVNDITKLFYSTINNDFIEPEQINGYIDHSDEIEELTERISDLEEINDDGSKTDEIEELTGRISDLEYDQEYPPEIYQYFIVSESGADILQNYTNDPVYYIDLLDMYIWGVTHWSTSWDYVLTDVKLKIQED